MISVAFSGRANSGKTTLITSLCKLLQPSAKILAIKHDPKDKAQVDREQKDSGKFFTSGADVVLLSSVQSFLRFHQGYTLEEMVKGFLLNRGYDYLFIEGFLNIPLELPRICVAREILEDRFRETCCAFATDSSISSSLIPHNKSHLNLNNPKEILEWIQTHIKEYVW